jgi:5-methyltetrahydrofolate--homocysteine methyltransferase
MSLSDFFHERSIMLLDGATGSQLIARGLQAGECPELWNVTHPQKIREIASMYFEAGSDAVLTNTFGGSLHKLKDYGLQDRVYELNFQGAKNALEVRPDGKFVLGSIGPSGKMLEPYGDTSEQEVTASFEIQAEALADAGVDGFMLETFQDIRELLCAAEAVKRKSNLPFIASLTYSPTPGGFFTIMGNGVAEAAEVLGAIGAFAIGSNCGNGPGPITKVGRQLRALLPGIVIMLKPNAGEPVLKDGLTCYTENAETFGRKFAELKSLSPVILGGCCGTEAEHIREFRRRIDLIE